MYCSDLLSVHFVIHCSHPPRDNVLCSDLLSEHFVLHCSHKSRDVFCFDLLSEHCVLHCSHPPRDNVLCSDLLFEHFVLHCSHPPRDNVLCSDLLSEHCVLHCSHPPRENVYCSDLLSEHFVLHCSHPPKDNVYCSDLLSEHFVLHGAHYFGTPHAEEVHESLSLPPPLSIVFEPGTLDLNLRDSGIHLMHAVKTFLGSFFWTYNSAIISALGWSLPGICSGFLFNVFSGASSQAYHLGNVIKIALTGAAKTSTDRGRQDQSIGSFPPVFRVCGTLWDVMIDSYINEQCLGSHSSS